MALACTSLTTAFDADNNPASTAAVNPASGSITYLFLTWAVAGGGVCNDFDVLTPSGARGTWTELARITNASSRRGMALFRGTGSVANEAISISITPNAGTWVETGWNVIECTGFNAGDPDDDPVTADNPAGQTAGALPDVGTVDAGDAVLFGIMHETSEGVTATGWTALGALTGGSHTRTLHTFYDDSSPDETPNVTWASSSSWGMIGLVVNVGAASSDIAAAGSLAFASAAALNASGALAAAGAVVWSSSADLTEAASEDITATGAVTWGSSADLDAVGALAATGSVAFTPATEIVYNHVFVELTSINTTAAYRITASPDLEIGDHLEARGVGGGPAPDGLTLNADATFSFSGAAQAFDVRAWDSNDGTWGAWATQDVGLEASGSLAFASAAALRATGALSATGASTFSSSADLTSGANNSIAAAGGMLWQAAAVLTAVGILSGAGGLTWQSSANLTGATANNMSALGYMPFGASAELSAVGSLSVSGFMVFSGSAIEGENVETDFLNPLEGDLLSDLVREL